MTQSLSPLAPQSYPEMPHIGGVRMATVEAGIKHRNRRDVLLALLDAGTHVAGVFTRSRCPSAPVDWCRQHIAQGTARVLVVNSGNANAFTGMKGRSAVETTAAEAARVAGVSPRQVFLASTGVIGEPLDPARFTAVLEQSARQAIEGNWMDAAKAIMTTDTFPKLATRRLRLDGAEVAINGIAKGAGMIAPDMATMLAFIFTDAAVEAGALQAALAKHVGDTFNAVTVDGDTSTSDTVLAFATGAAMRGKRALAAKGDRRFASFARALGEVMMDLAIQIARDGEGASKFVTVNVRGAVSGKSARRVAMSIANSPLVKTAIAGEDANWGRVVMAVGKAGEPAERDRLSIWFGDIQVAANGERAAGYSEAQAAAYMKSAEIEITVDLALGRGRAAVYTCDLTHDYIRVNADYRS